MNDTNHTHICTVCNEPIGEHETVEVVCKHTRPTTTETSRTLTDGTEEHTEQSDALSEDVDLTDRQEELLEELHRVADIVGHSPSISDINEHGSRSVKSYLKHFDGWNDAKEVAGLEIYKADEPNPDFAQHRTMADGGCRDEQQTFTDVATRADESVDVSHLD